MLGSRGNACNGPRIGIDTHPSPLSCWTCGETPEAKPCAGFKPDSHQKTLAEWSKPCLRDELCAIQVWSKMGKKRKSKVGKEWKIKMIDLNYVTKNKATKLQYNF